MWVQFISFCMFCKPTRQRRVSKASFPYSGDCYKLNTLAVAVNMLRFVLLRSAAGIIILKYNFVSFILNYTRSCIVKRKYFFKFYQMT